MKRIQIIETAQRANQNVFVSGWVHSRRDHGKIIFIDLRDRSGLVQIVFIPNDKKTYFLANQLRPEWVIEIEGKVKTRPKGMKNPKIKTGKIEIDAKKLSILAKADVLPFEIDKDTKNINEELRMKYRYLDLRSSRMQKNLELRHKVIKYIRDFLTQKGFWEVETPILTKSTPEGARDYLVPSRQHPNSFYALPQSPQQYKQLLMVSSIEKYFQIARCFRDEDPRGDRQPEFTQLDIEMSFVSQEDILALIENLFISLIKEVFPEKKITQVPFFRLSYDDVMKKYKTDKPDLRKDKKNPDELAFAFVVNWPMFEKSKDGKHWDPHHHIFTSPKQEDIPLLDKNPSKVRSYQHDIVLNGYEIGGGSIRITDPFIQTKVLELVGLNKDEIQKRFGHLLKSFKYGIPPHGGIAPGIDRFLMILLNEPNIREVIAFPKTGDGQDLMMEAPSEIDKKQLKEISLKVLK